MTANEASVHTGIWFNHQYSSVKGATLTLASTNASYLVAFLALFLGLVAGHLWAIVSFAIFHIRSTTTKRDGQHHQQQVILRNYQAPGAAIWQLLKVSWSWRQRRGLKAGIVALPIVMLALTYMMQFIAAGVISARVQSKDSEVLIKGSSCGFWNPGTQDELLDDFVAQAAYRAHLAEDLASASIMASMCQSNSSISSGCVSYAPRKIEWTTSSQAPCPFDEKICYQNATVRLDSGLIDSLVNFGINAAQKDRIYYRSVAECSPLVRDGYVQDWHDMNGTRLTTPWTTEKDVIKAQPGELFLELFYGIDTIDDLNSTILYSNRDPTVTVFPTQPFTLTTTLSVLEDPAASGLIPISELNRTNADLNLLFLLQGSAVQYSKAVNDPWFEAKSPKSVPYEYQPGHFRNGTAYNPEIPISTVGCAMQHQWCSDPGTGSGSICTDLTGIEPSIRQARQLFKRDKQQVTLERTIQTTKSVGDLSKIILSIPGGFLLMNKYGYFRLAAPADDQWIQELSHLFGLMLTAIQIRNYRFAGGYHSVLDITPVIQTPPVNATWMCDAQIVRREDYQSLSVLGLALVCSIGSFVILINLTLESIVGCYQKRYNKRGFAMQEWEMLQAEALQRQLYMCHGLDLGEERVSVADVLGNLKTWMKNGMVVTILENGGETGSMSSIGTTGKTQSMGTDVERCTERVLAASESPA